MPRYKCINTKCDNFNKISDNVSVNNKYTQDGVIDMNLECSACTEPRQKIEENKGFCTTIHGGENICRK